VSRRDDAWASDAAHEVLKQQTAQHLADAQQAARAAEAAAAQAAQLRNRGQK
jgi:hypothetical protein